MHACIYVYTVRGQGFNACMHSYTHTHTHTHACIHACIHTHTHIPRYMHAWMDAYMYTPTTSLYAGIAHYNRLLRGYTTAYPNRVLMVG